jgi:plastocyanin
MRVVSVVLASVLVGALGCGGSSTSTGPSASGHTTSLAMHGSAFSPAVDTVAVGANVTWTNQDGMAHTVTTAPGAPAAISSGSVAGGGTYSHVFGAAGTYQYYCTFHGTPTSGMRGTIVVQ